MEYGDFFKWFLNTKEGLPAYITVDMVTQEADVVRLSDLGLEECDTLPQNISTGT